MYQDVWQDVTRSAVFVTSCHWPQLYLSQMIANPSQSSAQVLWPLGACISQLVLDTCLSLSLCRFTCPQVVKYIKYLPYIKTHLRHPKSSLVEMVVIDILEQLKKAQPKDKLTGADGFDTLLSEVLSLIADPNQGKQLQGMRADKWFMQFSYVELDTDAWKEAARSLLNDFNNERGWLRPVARASEK